MTEFVAHITSLVSEISSSLLMLLGFAAVVAILVLVLFAFFGHTAQDKARAISGIVTILVLCAVAAFASPLVMWAMS